MSKSTTTPLEGHVGYWLRYVSNHVSHAFAHKIEERGVTAAEWVLMRELFDSRSRPPSEIAAAMGMTRGAISKLADRLVEKSLVTRKQSGRDRRWQSLALTASGRALVPKLAALADRNDAEFFGHWKATERAAFVGAMKDIIRRSGLRTIPTT